MSHTFAADLDVPVFPHNRELDRISCFFSFSLHVASVLHLAALRRDRIARPCKRPLPKHSCAPNRLVCLALPRKKKKGNGALRKNMAESAVAAAKNARLFFLPLLEQIHVGGMRPAFFFDGGKSTRSGLSDRSYACATRGLFDTSSYRALSTCAG